MKIRDELDNSAFKAALERFLEDPLTGWMNQTDKIKGFSAGWIARRRAPDVDLAQMQEEIKQSHKEIAILKLALATYPSHAVALAQIGAALRKMIALTPGKCWSYEDDNEREIVKRFEQARNEAEIALANYSFDRVVDSGNGPLIDAEIGDPDKLSRR